MTRDYFSTNTLNHYTIRPDEVQEGDTFGIKIVACIWPGWNGWCAFSGPPDWSDQKIAAQGDEISFEAAEKLFPTLANLDRVYSNS